MPTKPKKPTPKVPENLVDAILNGARIHGEESGIEMRVGDLEGARSGPHGGVMTNEQRAKLFDAHEVEAIVEWLPPLPSESRAP